LAAILCHALTGQPPYDGEVQGDVLFERLEHEVTRIEALLPSVRPATAAALNHMLAANAEDRPQSWGETVEMLTRARAGVPGAARRAASAVAIFIRGRAANRREWFRGIQRRTPAATQLRYGGELADAGHALDTVWRTRLRRLAMEALACGTRGGGGQPGRKRS
jgi:hypothetical protein